MSTSAQIWKECCALCNVQYASKGSEDYLRVLQVFKDRMNDIRLEEMRVNNPQLYLWMMCCKELKIDSHLAKKGTQLYEKVKALYKTRV